MKKTLACAALALALPAARAADPTAAEVLASMKKVADWQLVQTNRHAVDDWTYGALYAGMMGLADVADTPKYHDAMMAMGEANGWKPAKRTYHADDHCVSQTYLELYYRHRDPKMLAPTRARLDEILAAPATNKTLEFKQKKATDRWSWCDALFMGPPAWARLALATGDKKYFDFMNREFKATQDYLYDKEEHLFFRDSTYFEKREANGKKVFWSRGNGWVLAGLARLLQVLPPEAPQRPAYLALYKEMAAKIASIQPADGLWHPSLLDPDSYPIPETSGSGFYCFGLAWGINRGLLDEATYGPVVRKAWAGLLGCVQADGKLTHVQPVGADPRQFDLEHSDVFGVGAFLLAGSEVYRLALARPPAFAYGAFMAQRKDDYAWENDRIAYRIYGPALEIAEPATASGLDVWCKRTRKPVIEKWYLGAEYHKDSGEGLDYYKVGPTRGCGGTGIWRDGKLYASKNFRTWRTLRNGPDAVSFELGYAPWDAGGLKVRETKKITLEAGANLNRLESTFAWEGGPDTLPVAVGVASREGGAPPVRGPDNRWLAYWEPEHGADGALGCAVILPEKAEFVEAPGQFLLVAPVARGGTLTYRAGACWSKSGDCAGGEAWAAYVREQAEAKGGTP